MASIVEEGTQLIIPEGLFELQTRLEKMEDEASSEILCLNGAHTVGLERCRLHWRIEGQEHQTVYVGPIPVYRDVLCDVVHIHTSVLEAVEDCIQRSSAVRGEDMKIERPNNLSPIEIS